MNCYTHELMDAVAEQIANDVVAGDFTAIQELLENLEAHQLEAYLPEETAEKLMSKWGLLAN